MGILEIRPSTISSMMLCPARQILKSDDQAVTAEALIFGTLTHWRIEQDFHDRTVSTDRLMQALVDVYAADTNGGDILEVLSKRDMRKLCAEVERAYMKWTETVAQFLPDEDPVVEKTLRVVLSDSHEKQIVLTGTPDAIFPKAGVIVDWKTAGRNWNVDKVQGQVQPWAYSLMAEGSGYDIEEFHFWVYDRSTESWWCHVHRLDNLVMAHHAFVQQAIGFALMIDADVPVYSPAGSGWKPRGWHCSPSYCDQWDHCPGKYLVADGKATLPALNAEEKGWT